MSAPRTTRPGSVTVVVVLVWISAVLSILAGVLILVTGLAARNAGRDITINGVSTSTASNGTTAVVVVGVAYLLIGLVTALVASRLSKGSRGARLIVTILEVLLILSALTTLFTVNSSSSSVSSAVVTLVFAAVILVLLWNQTANRYFA